MNVINNNLTPDDVQVKNFLQGRMGAVEDGFLVIFCAKGKDGPKRTKFFGPGDSDKAALYCVDMAQKGWDVYFGQGILKSPLQSPSRGSTEDVVAILGFWFDGDLRGGIHSEDPENLPTAGELETFFRDEIPFRLSQTIASSPDGGRHLHWLFNEPFLIRSEDDRAFIKTLSTRFQQVIIKKMKAKPHEWNQDNTADLVRVLRIPGTFNFKGDPPVPVAMVEETGFRYKVDAIIEWVGLEEETQQGTHGREQSTKGREGGHRDVEKAIQGCEFLRYCRDNAPTLTEPQWWAMVCALALEHDAEKIIHEMSKVYPGYTEKETAKKIEEAQKLSGPMTCKAIREKTSFEGCPSGGCGVGCPVHLGGGRVEWEKPVHLDDYQVPQFDVELPGILGQMCKATAAATETPIELAVGDCLAVLATTVHGKAIVRVDPGHDEPLNIWTAVFLEPGNRKTAVLKETTKPLMAWEAAKRQQERPRIKAIRSDMKSQESRLKHLRTEYGKAKDEKKIEELQHEILTIEMSMVDEPYETKVWTDDVTPENFGTQLGRYDGRMAIISSEGGIIETIGGRYSKGVPNMDIFLKSHAGDPVRVDRGNRESVDLQNPASTFGLSPQPAVLRAMAAVKGAKGRGFLGRFLYLLPKSNLGHRTLKTEPIPEPISRGWSDLIHTLLDIEPQRDEAEQVEPFEIHLTGTAYDEWMDFSMEVEVGMAEGGRFENMKDWAAKLPGAAARLAGLLHCVNHPSQPWGEKISAETMGTVLELAAVLASHAEVAFDLMGADETIEGAKKVWRWIESGRYENFTKRDCFQALKGTFHRVSDLEVPLEILVERNYLMGFDANKGGKGRSSISFNVNPEFIETWR